MNAIDPALDAAALLAWLVTFFLHSTALLGIAWVATRAMRTPRLRELAWRTALAGGLGTATVLSALGGGPLTIDAHFLAHRSGADNVAPTDSRTPPPIGLEAGEEEWERVELGRLTMHTVSGPLAAPAGSSPRDRTAGAPRIGPPAIACAAWLVLAASGLVRLYLRRRRLAAVLRDRRELHAGPLVETLMGLQARDGPRRRVRLTSSARVGSPLAIGLAEICVPDYAVRGLGPASRAALLAHELAHLRRGDAAWGLFAAVLARLFPFQPLLRIAERRLRTEAELCCDAAAVRATGDGEGLARCLLEVAERTQSTRAPVWSTAMAAPRSELVARVEAAIAGGAPVPTRARIAATAAACWIVLAALACVGPGVRSAEEEESEPPARDAASSGARAPAAMQPRSSGYSLTESTDPTDERPVLSVWEDGELVHRAPTDDPAADLAKAQRGLGYISSREATELAPSPPGSAGPSIPGPSAPGPAGPAAPGPSVPGPAGSTGEREDPSGEGPAGAPVSSPGDPGDPEHVVLLRIDADGTLHGDGAVLVAADDDDFTPVREFLAAKARAMPRLVDPRAPDAAGLPNGMLRVAGSEKASFSRVLLVMMQCGLKDVQIWRLEFQVERADGTQERIPYALPRDPPAPDGELPAPPRFTIELRGEALTLRVPPQMGEGFSSKSQRLEVLSGMVQVLTQPYPDASFTIDVQPGTSYAQVAAVLGALKRAGARNILFVGRRDY